MYQPRMRRQTKTGKRQRRAAGYSMPGYKLRKNGRGPGISQQNMQEREFSADRVKKPGTRQQKERYFGRFF